MLQERPNFETAVKAIQTTPFKDIPMAMRKRLPDDKRFELSQIPGLDVEQSTYIKHEETSVFEEIFPSAFSYTRFVDKEGNLHYWSIDLAPQPLGQTERTLTDLVQNEPGRKEMIKSLRQNLPKLRISPDQGIVMSFAGGIALSVTEDGNFKTGLIGEKQKLNVTESEIDDIHYKSESLRLSIEEYVFDDNRRDDVHFYTMGNIKYLNLDVEEILTKLGNQLQSALITESMVRSLVNPRLHVSIDAIGEGPRQVFV